MRQMPSAWLQKPGAGAHPLKTHGVSDYSGVTMPREGLHRAGKVDLKPS